MPQEPAHYSTPRNNLGATIRGSDQHKLPLAKPQR
jgi:hypothetical protein